MSQFANPVPMPAEVRACQPNTAASDVRKCLQSTSSRFPREASIPGLQSTGQTLPASLRDHFEPFFGHNFSRVRIHNDDNAHLAAIRLDADAFAHGSHIAFAANRYLPDTVGGRRLLAHELAHVVQQGMPVAVDTEKRPKTKLGPLPQSAEYQADIAAQACLAGRRAPALSRFAPGIACAVKTNGGQFDTDVYAPTNQPPKGGGKIGKRVGAEIKLRFTPNELVEADLIGTVQTVRTLMSTKVGGPVDTLNAPTPHMGARALVKGESDPGRFIDQTDLGAGKKPAPNTSPLYATNAQQGDIPKSLTDGVPPPETTGAGKGYGKNTFGEHGYRKKKLGGGFEVKDATLADGPGSTITPSNREFEMKFEVAALALSGPMANTYLGSVEWGWKCDASGTATVEPAAIKLVSPGLPTGAFVDAGKKWNAAKTVKDPKRNKTLDTIDLPLPASATETSSKPAGERSTGEMLVALGAVNSALTTAKNVDKNAKTLEKNAMQQALNTRQVIVDVKVNKTEDWTGADEVYALLKSGNKRARTPVKNLNDGQSGQFTLPLPALMPINGPIHVQIYDEDLGTFFDQDDLIVNMPWQAPYGAIRNPRSLDGADYDVHVRFDR
ncbi:MAG: hypothetical protein H6R14_1439 [Proteobacteria bacterium]|nr:hypothetical protein [Pseudomonadota bacterium]